MPYNKKYDFSKKDPINNLTLAEKGYNISRYMVL
jgi:hypothetical protein